MLSMFLNRNVDVNMKTVRLSTSLVFKYDNHEFAFVSCSALTVEWGKCVFLF